MKQAGYYLHIVASMFGVILLTSCGGGGGSSNGNGNSNSVISGAQRFANGYGSNPSVSDDGRYITYAENQIYRLDRLTGVKITISVNKNGTGVANGLTYSPVISGDGSYVLFSSKATNLVSGITSYPIDSSNQVVTQLYVRDVQGGTTSLVTINPSGTGAANDWTNYDKYTISRNGKFAVFSSQATNLVAGISYFGGGNVFLRDLTSQTTELVSIATDGVSSGKGYAAGGFNDSYFPAISDDGRYVSFESYAWNLFDGVTYTPDIFGTVSNIFVRDRIAKSTMLISLSPDGTQASNGYCSAQLYNGRYMSANGTTIVFSSRATNLADATLLGTGKTNIFLSDQATVGLTLISVGAGGVAANGNSYTPTISADGNYVAFSSNATNLIGASIGYWIQAGIFASNIYRWGKNSGEINLVSLSSDGTSGADFNTQFPALSNDGKIVVFSGAATNLTVSPSVPLSFDHSQDSVYRWDSVAGKSQLVTQSNYSSFGNTNPVFGMSGDGGVVAFDSGSLGSFFIVF